MKLSIDQVRKVAKLANLPLTSEEEEMYSEQLSAILDYIDKLNSADTKDVEPTFNVTGKNNILAEDEVKPNLTQKEALQNASKVDNGMFLTKGVFEND